MIDKKPEPAFPMQFADDSHQPGMTLRDYFAAKAMGDIFKDWKVDLAVSGECLDLSDHADALCIAKDCYRLADAMLEARNAKP